MTPLELIRQGILTDNMKLVEQGYKNLTGEDVISKPKPVIKGKRGRKKKIIEEEIEEIVEEVEENKSVRPVKKDIINDSNQEGKRQGINTSLVLHNFKNKFVDDGKLFRNLAYDKKFKYKRITPRKPPAKKVRVKCVKCDKKYEIYPKYLPPKIDGEQSYVCDRCIPKG